MAEAFELLQQIIVGASLITISPIVANGFLKVIDHYNQAKKEVREVKREMAGNTMFYYYKADKDLRH